MNVMVVWRIVRENATSELGLTNSYDKVKEFDKLKRYEFKKEIFLSFQINSFE